MASRTAAALTALALAALSVAAVLTLGRVFASGRFALPVIGAVLLAHLLGFLARARRWPLIDALSLWAGGLAVYLIWVLAVHTTAFGLPTAETFRVLADRLGDGLHDLRTAVVPAPSTDGAIMLCVLVAWIMAATADALAFWRRATIGAVAPALALFVWASTLGADALATATTAGFIVTALLFVLVQQQALLERGRSRFAGRRVRGMTGVWSVGAVAGALAVLGGLVVGPALPGADADPLLDVRGGNGSGRTYRAEPPLARIGADYVGRGRVEVFTVRAPREEYWRIAALDAYESVNGGQWTLSAQGGDQVKEGLHATVDDTMLRQEFHITDLEDRWLPAAYQPVNVEGGDDPLVVQASTTLVSSHGDVKDLTYAVSSRLGRGSDAPLTDGERQATNAPVPSEMRRYTALPDDFPADVRAKALEVTDGKATPFDRARALEQFFLDPAEGFNYSLDVDLGPEAQTQSAIQEFLRSRRGFCVQFASTFAAMARAVGLPARVAVGYTPGLYDSTARVYRVTSEDAHAWAEVWLAGLGWTRFEPTPASDLPGGSRLPGRGPAPALSGSAAPTPATGAPAPPPTSAGESPAPSNPAEVAIDPPAADGGDDDGLTFSWMFAIVLLLGAVAGAVVVAAGIVIAKRRRRLRRRSRPDPAAAITGAWEEVLDRLGEAGVDRAPSRTPLELADHASARVPGAASPPLQQLARTYTATRYAPSPPDRALVGAAWRDAGAVSSALRAGVSVRERWRRWLDPTALRR
jgi:transglutaminase-like putative cysteine protease